MWFFFTLMIYKIYTVDIYDKLDQIYSDIFGTTTWVKVLDEDENHDTAIFVWFDILQVKIIHFLEFCQVRSVGSFIATDDCEDLHVWNYTYHHIIWTDCVFLQELDKLQKLNIVQSVCNEMVHYVEPGCMIPVSNQCFRFAITWRYIKTLCSRCRYCLHDVEYQY